MPVRKMIRIPEFEAFLALPENRDRTFELIRGTIYEKVPTQEHGFLLVRIGGKIANFLELHRLGVVYAKAYHQLPTTSIDSRRPDIAYMSFERSRTMYAEGAVPLMPDLVVEIKLPDEFYTNLCMKAHYFLKRGTKAAWLVFPEKKSIQVHKPGVETILLTINETLDGGDILPGFSVPLTKIFRS